jgi:hypothetical protein
MSEAMTMETAVTAPDAIRAYWMTGCSSCLRTKEFLQKNGVPFLSRNVLQDETAFQELERFGLKQVPIAKVLARPSHRRRQVPVPVLNCLALDIYDDRSPIVFRAISELQASVTI